jgi:hypothetical protein
MKATIEFDLSKHEERISHLQAIKASDMVNALFHIKNNLKKKLINQWGEMNGSTEDMIDLVFSEIFDIIDQNNINIDELCQ